MARWKAGALPQRARVRSDDRRRLDAAAHAPDDRAGRWEMMRGLVMHGEHGGADRDGRGRRGGGRVDGLDVGEDLSRALGDGPEDAESREAPAEIALQQRLRVAERTVVG
jgi:hypothetical protein